MADDANKEDTSTQDPQEKPTPGGGDASKTFTEAEFNSMLTARLSKQEKSFEKRLADELKKAEERAKLGDAERLQAERDDLTRRRTSTSTRTGTSTSRPF